MKIIHEIADPNKRKNLKNLKHTLEYVDVNKIIPQKNV